jgi:hypothetical protein
MAAKRRIEIRHFSNGELYFAVFIDPWHVYQAFTLETAFRLALRM